MIQASAVKAFHYLSLDHSLCIASNSNYDIYNGRYLRILFIMDVINYVINIFVVHPSRRC